MYAGLSDRPGRKHPGVEGNYVVTPRSPTDHYGADRAIEPTIRAIRFKRWIDLGNQLSIHGPNDPKNIGRTDLPAASPIQQDDICLGSKGVIAPANFASPSKAQALSLSNGTQNGSPPFVREADRLFLALRLMQPADRFADILGSWCRDAQLIARSIQRLPSGLARIVGPRSLIAPYRSGWGIAVTTLVPFDGRVLRPRRSGKRPRTCRPASALSFAG